MKIAIGLGRIIDTDKPDLTGITLEEIAHGLAEINRFARKTFYPYSVAQHAVLVAEIIFASWNSSAKSITNYGALAALHHDDHEFFTGDIIWPVQNACDMENLKTAQRNLDQSILEKIPTFLHENT